MTMLSTIPTELQAQILSYLPRKDLVAVARVSQHLHAVAIKILYRKVQLRSRKHFDSFFLPIAAAEHAKARTTQWKDIKVLVLDFSNFNDRAPPFELPRSMRGRNVEPLRLDRLQLGRTPGIGAILSFLDPLELTFDRKHSWEAQFASLDCLPEGKRRRTKTVRLSVKIPVATRPLSLPPSPSSSFSSVTSAAMELRIGTSLDRNPREGEEVVLWILRFFPSLERLRIVVVYESRKKALDSLFKNGYGGKGEDFFTVEVGVPLKEVAF